METKIEKRRTKNVTCVTRAALLVCVTSGLYAFFGLPFPLHAQAPTFRTGTTLVEFTVVALDDQGNAVTDLTRDELTVTEKGRRREIAFFQFDGQTLHASLSSSPLLPLGYVSNHPKYIPTSPRNVIAVAVDGSLSMEVQAQLLTYLDKIPAGTRVALYSIGERTQALHDFTEDTASLRARLAQGHLQPVQRTESESINAAMARLARADGGRPSPRGGASQQAVAEMAAGEKRARDALNYQIVRERVRNTLNGVEAVSHHLAGIPGRKSLLFISTGFPIRSSEPNVPHFQPELLETVRRVANDNVAIYAIDAVGLAAPTISAGGNDSDTVAATTANLMRARAASRTGASFDLMADVTGGAVSRNSNDLTLGLTKAVDDLRGMYSLGYYAADDSNDEWRPVQVTVKRPGVTLRYRRGYLPSRRAQSWPTEAWTRIASQPLDSTAIRLHTRTDVVGNTITASIQIASADLYFHERQGRMIADLEIGLVEEQIDKPTNVRVQPMEITLNKTINDFLEELIPITTTWPVNAGTTSVRVIVRDRSTGRYGTLEMLLKSQ
jgi:VWFA-related protein